MKTCVIYHNPRCSKSREALQILNDLDLNPVIIEYLKTPPTVKELKQLLALLNISVRDLLRKKEEVYKSLKLDNQNLKDDDILLIISQNPILLERPIVIIDNRAIIARPPERIISDLIQR